jgi:hypothetical protein
MQTIVRIQESKRRLSILKSKIIQQSLLELATQEQRFTIIAEKVGAAQLVPATPGKGRRLITMVKALLKAETSG